jgi:hypothetical protein
MKNDLTVINTELVKLLKEVAIFSMLRHYPSSFLEGLRKAMKNLSHVGQFSFEDLNQLIPKYKAGLLTATSRCLVLCFEMDTVLISHEVYWSW